MKFLIVFLIVYNFLFGESFTSYQDNIGRNIVEFDKKYGQVIFDLDKKLYDDFHKQNGILLTRSIFITNVYDLDLLVLLYTDYKFKIENRFKSYLILHNILDNNFKN